MLKTIAFAIVLARFQSTTATPLAICCRYLRSMPRQAWIATACSRPRVSASTQRRSTAAGLLGPGSASSKTADFSKPLNFTLCFSEVSGSSPLSPGSRPLYYHAPRFAI